jgi:HD-GYP domain-containing protein (c-di-GMP phosphodiesterase class II)
MASTPRPHAHLRFAILSFVLVALLAGGLVALLRADASATLTAEAERATVGLVGDPAVAALGSDAGSESAVTSTANSLAPFVGGSVLALRVWSDHALVTSRGADVAITQPSGAAHARLETAAGKDVFAVYLYEPGYTLEVDREAAPIDNTISAVQAGEVRDVVLLALLAFACLQGVFWLSMRRWAGEHRRLEYMYTRGQEIRASLDIDDVVGQVTRDAAKLGEAQFGILALYDSETGDLLLRGTHDLALGATQEHQRPIDDWYLRRAVATQSIIIATQPASQFEPLFPAESEFSGQMHVATVPLAQRDRVVGALAVIRSVSAGSFGAAEVRAVQELADQAVMAVEQAQLFAKVRSYASELETSYDTTLKVLMAALDTKDDATEGHCERVAKLTVHLARQMGMPESALVDLERGALLHDVGKIGVPDEVLHKPKDLNEMEWEAMRKHPLLAGVMVGKVGFLEGALPILLYHHERYDGGGYPFGLAEERIPVDARIFSVVDSYDAMTSDRPYRNAMTHGEAMLEIRANSGTQFDPTVVDAFERLMETKPHLQAHTPHPISGEHIDHDESGRLPHEEEPAA